MIELRKQVERIVRPIRASNRRKDRMREELLAHLTTIYGEEIEKTHDDAAGALAAASERFGDPVALRAELQASVPLIESVLCTSIPPTNGRFPRRPGETVPQFLRRLGPWVTLCNAVVWVLFALFIVFVSRQHPERNAAVSVTAFVFLCVANAIFFPLLFIWPELLCDAVARQWDELRDPQRSVRQRARRSIAAKLLVVVLVRSCTMLPFVLLLRHIGVYPFTTRVLVFSHYGRVDGAQCTGGAGRCRRDATLEPLGRAGAERRGGRADIDHESGPLNSGDAGEVAQGSSSAARWILRQRPRRIE